MDYSKPIAKRVPMYLKKKLFRMEWAKQNMNKHWYRAVFSDEASFWLRNGKLRMWTKGKKTSIIPTVKHSPNLHIWAAFSSMGTFPLCVFIRNLDGQFFVEILKWDLLDQARAFHGDSWILLKHTSRVLKTWMCQNMKKHMMDQSPDINAIENLFAWLKQKLSRNRFRTLEELKSENSGVIVDSHSSRTMGIYYNSGILRTILQVNEVQMQVSHRK